MEPLVSIEALFVTIRDTFASTVNTKAVLRIAPLALTDQYSLLLLKGVRETVRGNLDYHDFLLKFLIQIFFNSTQFIIKVLLIFIIKIISTFTILQFFSAIVNIIKKVLS